MSPTLAQLIIFALQELLTHAPSFVVEIQAILNKPDATNADWEALAAKVTTKSYHDYVPDSVLPKPTPTDTTEPS